jgi:organic radical activating enzyme
LPGKPRLNATARERLVAWLGRWRNRPVLTARGKLRIHTLEFFLINTCNLRCSHCAASSPFLGQTDLPDLDDFRQDLAALAPVLECGQLKLLGGEPLLNRRIGEYLSAARECGMFRRLRVTTNGLLLHTMPEEFWKAVDIVEISLYPASRSSLTGKSLAQLRNTARQFGARLEVREMNRFRESVRNTPAEDPRMVEEIFSACSEAHEWSCHLLYRRKLYRCSRVHTIDRYLAETGVRHESFTELDGFPVDGRPALRDELYAYLTSRVPQQACRFCHGTSGSWVPHRQLTVEEIRSRRILAHGPPP